MTAGSSLQRRPTQISLWSLMCVVTVCAIALAGWRSSAWLCSACFLYAIAIGLACFGGGRYRLQVHALVSALVLFASVAVVYALTFPTRELPTVIVAGVVLLASAWLTGFWLRFHSKYNVKELVTGGTLATLAGFLTVACIAAANDQSTLPFIKRYGLPNLYQHIWLAGVPVSYVLGFVIADTMILRAEYRRHRALHPPPNE